MLGHADKAVDQHEVARDPFDRVNGALGNRVAIVQ
jgi:hypothetical protein